MTTLIRPVDLPALRDLTAEHVQRTGYSVYERAINDGRQTIQPMTATPQAAAHMAASEVRRLQRADLFYVTEPMTELATAAGRSLPGFHLMPEDLPAPVGFMYFAKPIDVVDYGKYYEGEGCSPIVAVAWSSPWTGGNPDWKRGGVWFTWYGDRDAMLQHAVERGIFTRAKADDLRAGVGPLLIDNESASPFTPEPVPDQHGSMELTGIVAWMATLKSAWLLMSQPLARVEDAQFDRAARRRAQREGKQPPRVRVIHLRRPAGAQHGPGGREYHHQWVVRGHWRQQWYPSREAHRPVWIAPHVKGPEDAPLLVGEKVHVWSR